MADARRSAAWDADLGGCTRPPRPAPYLHWAHGKAHVVSGPAHAAAEPLIAADLVDAQTLCVCDAGSARRDGAAEDRAAALVAEPDATVAEPQVPVAEPHALAYPW